MLKNHSILLVGPTGSGKTPLGDLLERRGLWSSECVHFDFGQQLRTITSAENPPDFLSREDVNFLKSVLSSGALLEKEHFYIAEKILLDFASKRISSREEILILNGLPRHASQAEDVDGVVSIGCVVELSCSAEVVFQRIRSDTGGDRSQRVDDDTHAIERKIHLYHNRTRPILEHYRQKGVKIVTIEIGSGATAEDVWENLNSRPPAIPAILS